MALLSFFSANYRQARERFREAAGQAGWQLKTYPIEARSPEGDLLTIDVAIREGASNDGTLIYSSGVHGVEGYIGSAAQLALLQQWRTADNLPRCVFIHAVNPYGFAWDRRFDEKNVDPNRNFLLPGDVYRGTPPGYQWLDPVLNPPSPPRRWNFFKIRAALTVLRHGMPMLRQAIAAGQYDHPRGLFFGGQGPSESNRIMAEHFDTWVGSTRQVFHLDVHTGLGEWGDCKLLIDGQPSEEQRERLARVFGPDSFEVCDSSGISYLARGGWGEWCAARHPDVDYQFLCAEFGTYPGITVLDGLRSENQAHHYAQPGESCWHRAKRRLREVFCPENPDWRSRVLEKCIWLAEQARAELQAHRVLGRG